MQRTLILVKPDAVQRGIIGEVIARFERKGLKMIGMKMMSLNEAILRDHYSHIADKPFYPGVESFMMSSPVVAIAVEGLDVIDTVRRITGITKSREAQPGTVRGDYAMSVACNVIHTSDSEEAAKDELSRFFNEDEFFSYDKSEYMHVYAEDER